MKRLLIDLENEIWEGGVIGIELKKGDSYKNNFQPIFTIYITPPLFKYKNWKRGNLDIYVNDISFDGGEDYDYSFDNIKELEDWIIEENGDGNKNIYLNENKNWKKLIERDL